MDKIYKQATRQTNTVMKYFQEISVKYLGLRLVANKDKEILIDTLPRSGAHLVELKFVI